MKNLFTFAVVAASLIQVPAKAEQLFSCDNGALVITREKIGSPEYGHGYYSTRMVINDRGIAQYFVNSKAFNPGAFHADWNDAFYSKNDLHQDRTSNEYTVSEYITPGGYNPKTFENLIVLTRDGNSLRMEAFPVIGTYNDNRSPVLGNRLADWNFQYCN